MPKGEQRNSPSLALFLYFRANNKEILRNAARPQNGYGCCVEFAATGPFLGIERYRLSTGLRGASHHICSSRALLEKIGVAGHEPKHRQQVYRRCVVVLHEN